MVTPLTGTAVVFEGKILRTVDGGMTWTHQPSGDTHNLSCAPITDEEREFVVGEFTMLRTADGGLTWALVSRPMENASPFDVTFTNVMHGRAVGDFATMLRIEDGGVTWILEHSANDDAHVVHAVAIADESEAAAVGRFEDRQNVIHTTDGGGTWVPVATSHDRRLRSVHHAPGLLLVAGETVVGAAGDTVPTTSIGRGAFKTSHR